MYRAFAGKGLQFHPLANAARLNAHLAAGRDAEAARLADALVARAVPGPDGSAALEYSFRYWNVAPPWRSGMAQAVLAQALARAADRLGRPDLLAAAQAAYRAVPEGLLLDLDGGPWIRLYGRLDLVVLNAQLQSVLSLGDYATLAGDDEAAILAARMRSAAAALLPRFDTGTWSNYSPGNPSSLGYHRYVVSLLRRLGRETGDPLWSDTAERFAGYERQPPELRAGPAAPTLYPRPHDGHRDVARVRFWLSKPATVRLVVAHHTRRTDFVGPGWHALTWNAPASTPAGELPVTVIARGVAGNLARTDLPPVVVARDREPPTLAAAVAGGRLYWRAQDEGSAAVRLRLRLLRGGTVRSLDLGRRPLRGAVGLRSRLPQGRWWAVLEAVDASGNAARKALGRIA